MWQRKERAVTLSDVLTHFMVTREGKKEKEHVITNRRRGQYRFLCLFSLVCIFLPRLLYSPLPLYIAALLGTKHWHCDIQMECSRLKLLSTPRVFEHLKAWCARTFTQTSMFTCPAKRPPSNPPLPFASLLLAAKCFREEDGLIVSVTAIPLLHFSPFPS